MEDADLLREFAGNRSEEAFRLLVQRHLGFVYSVALRQLGDPHLAQEAAQSVFIDLAAKAGTLSRDIILTGWLFRATRYAASKMIRSETRRRHREQEAARMDSTPTTEPPDAPWSQLEPVLNEALDELSQKDRCALLLRFFEDQALRQIGARLGLNEAAAGKRVTRALEKLRLILQRRGLALSSAMLLAALSSHPAAAAPPGLAATIASTAILQGPAVSTSTLALAKSILKLMIASKVKALAATAVTFLCLGGAVTYIVQHHDTPAGAAESIPDDEAALLKIIDRMNSRALEAAPARVFVRPSDPENPRPQGAIVMNGKTMGRSISLRELMANAYGRSGSRLRWAGPGTWPQQRFDYLVSLPSGQREALQKEIRDRFGYEARLATNRVEVSVLKAKPGQWDGLRPTVAAGGRSSIRTGDTELTFENLPVTELITALERLLDVVIVDETALQGRYDVFLTWEKPEEKSTDGIAMRKAIAEQLGLELVTEQKPVEFLEVRGRGSR